MDTQDLILGASAVNGILRTLVLMCLPVASPAPRHCPDAAPLQLLKIGTVQLKRFRAVQREGHAGSAECLCPPNDGQLPILQQCLVFVGCAVARLKAGHERSRAASAVVTPGSQDFHTAARIKLQSVASWSSSRDRIAMSPVQLHRTHDLLALGLSMHSQIVLHAVRHPFEHGLEHGGVSSEEPDVVHPAEMRKGCVVHLLVVSLTADDILFSLCATVRSC